VLSTACTFVVRATMPNLKRLALGVFGVLAVVALCASSALASRDHNAPHPGLSSTIAHAASLSKYCARTMVNRFPHVVKRIPGTRYWGTYLVIRDSDHQEFGIKLEIKPMPEKCRDAGYRLSGKAVGSVVNPRHHRDLTPVVSVRYGNHAGERKADTLLPIYLNHKPIEYGCTPGKGKTPVWLDLSSKVVDRRRNVKSKKTKRVGVPVIRPPGVSAAC
jgi:hypothetical protein